MNQILRDYHAIRHKKHGAGGTSRRMALALALSMWGLSTRRVWVQRVIYLWLPEWMKCARSDWVR
jgi:hypothetical protein